MTSIIGRTAVLVLMWMLVFGGSFSSLKAQPAYWQFSPNDLLLGVELGKSQTDIVNHIVKNKRAFGKYNLSTKRMFVDSNINFVDHQLLSGTFALPAYHKLKEWFDERTMIVNYSMLFVNDVCVRLTLYFIYPSIEVGEMDKNYTDIISFFSQVGWFPFCSHPLWDLDVKCGYQTDYVPMFETFKGEDEKIRMYKSRLKIAKGLCLSSDHTLSESIEITISDAEALQRSLQLSSIEKAAFYGANLWGFALDKQLPACASPATR